MLSEFVDRLVTLGQGVQSAEFTVHQLLPRTLFVQHAGKLERIDAPAPLREHKLIGFTDLVAALTDKAIAPDPEVYIAGTAVVALLDRSERRSIVTMPLTESARFKLCVDLEKPRAFAPRDLVRFLRQSLYGVNDQLVQKLSRLDFTRTSTGKTDVKHGRETLGRSVEAVVQQAEDVPETFTLHVPIWTTPGCPWFRSIEFGIYLDVEKSAVELSVLSDSCTSARNGALADLRNAIAEACPDVPVFMGSP